MIIAILIYFSQRRDDNIIYIPNFSELMPEVTTNRKNAHK